MATSYQTVTSHPHLKKKKKSRQRRHYNNEVDLRCRKSHKIQTNLFCAVTPSRNTQVVIFRTRCVSWHASKAKRHVEKISLKIPQLSFTSGPCVARGETVLYFPTASAKRREISVEQGKRVCILGRVRWSSPLGFCFNEI